MKNLQHLVFPGKINTLIASFLSDRKQLVVQEVQKMEINVDVPQESILGPLIFLLFINDLLQNVQDIARFTDDTTSFISVINWEIEE